MNLELITHEPKARARAFPLLFVHGVYHAAWCWQNFLPYFADHGFRCHALSLRGHGASPGADGLAGTRFGDYVDDLRRVVGRLGGSAPVLVGHSLGGMLIRKYIETQLVPAAILISTPTPKSLLAGSLKLLRAFPAPMLKMALTLNPDAVYKDPKVVRTLFFSAGGAPEAAVSRLLQQAESRRLFVDVLLVKFAAPREEIPVMVLGGERDYGVHPAAFRETAAFYGTRPDILPGLPHDMMLDENWSTAAGRILAWLTEQGF